MASKKSSVRKKKSSRGLQSPRDSEILRAKRAVSAALSVEAVPSEAAETAEAVSSSGSGSIGGVMKGLVRAAANIVGQGTETEETLGATYSGLGVRANPLADMARRHITESSESLSRSGKKSEQLCRKVLADLARARLENTEGSFSQSTRT